MKIKDSLRSAIWNQEDDSFLFKDPRMPKVGSDESKNNEPDSSSVEMIGCGRTKLKLKQNC